MIRNFKRLDKKKRVAILISVASMVYSIVYMALSIGINLSLTNVLLSIKMPDFLLVDLSPEHPEFYMTFSLENNFYDINEFAISSSLGVTFSDYSNATHYLDRIFTTEENFGYVRSFEFYEKELVGSEEDFNTSALEFFWNNADINKTIFVIFDFGISGRYFANMVPFSLNIENINTTI